MQEIPLADYLKSHSQAQLAQSVGCHQTAISRMLREKRNVKVVTHDDGSIALRSEKIIAKTA